MGTAVNMVHIPYPETPDNSILYKQEFRTDISTRSETGGCESSRTKFDLSKAQAFVSAFMGPGTPYRSLLLFHGVGVGKTCSAIQIAEAHSGTKHTFVVAPQTTKSGFKNNIVESRSVPLTDEGFVDLPAHARNNCTGSTYTSSLFGTNITRADLRNSSNVRVSTRYKFFGYEQFVNILETTIAKVREKFVGFTDEKLKPEIDMVISEIYSNRVLIVDEAHNLRSSNVKGQKGLLDALRMIVGASVNIRLILLTATPMYNKHEEIVDIINLMLLNDCKPEITSSIFDSSGVLTPSGKKILEDAVKGRVSYMRGDNPDTFPLRITSNDALSLNKFPPCSFDYNGNPIKPSQQLNTQILHFSTLSKLQVDLYGDIVRDDSYDASVRWNSTYQQHCNITFGTKVVGEAGFKTVFSMKGIDNKMRVQYRGKRILSKQYIRDYSPKFYEIIKSIEESEGTVFVYSRYKWSGILPLAIALEERGFAPISGKPILADVRAVDGAPRYAMITSDDNFTATGISVGGVVSRVNAKNSNIKVILGTIQAAEGLDFKRIREVHIIDPWYHMNIIEQIVGRSIRYCSHADLPVEKRNVTIYLHCCAFSNSPDRRETNDEYMYRVSMKKLLKVGAITRILKQNAIDCSILRSDLYVSKRPPKEVITSRGTKIKVPIGDVDGSSACDFGKCIPLCPPPPKGRLDTSTFHPLFVRHMVEMMGWDIRELLESVKSMTYSEIYEQLGRPDDTILSLTLETLLNPLLSKKWIRDKVLLYISDIYVLVPSSFCFKTFTMEEIRTGVPSSPLTEKVLK
jgi:hypothetical protein